MEALGSAAGRAGRLRAFLHRPWSCMGLLAKGRGFSQLVWEGGKGETFTSRRQPACEFRAPQLAAFAGPDAPLSSLMEIMQLCCRALAVNLREGHSMVGPK